jgi:hypothetical protein
LRRRDVVPLAELATVWPTAQEAADEHPPGHHAEPEPLPERPRQLLPPEHVAWLARWM